MAASRRGLLATALVGITPFPAQAQTCADVPPFIRQDDPVQALFHADLHHWAMTNQQVGRAQVFVHPMFAYLVTAQGQTSEFATAYVISVQPQMPVPWAIVPECG